MAAADYTSRIVDYGTDPLVTSSGGVPSTRTIFATAPFLTINGGASANLSADVTLAAVTTGGGSLLVGSGRLLIGTSPVTINGGASHDHTTDLTIAVPSFAGTTPGLVPVGTNDGTLFLSQTGWTAGTVVGVASLAATQAITVSAATGAVTISSRDATLTTAGHVPSVGSVETTKFLCKTNPPTWATPVGTGPAVTLQGSTPGTADVGHAHITGVFIADTAIVAGTTKRSLNGLGNEPFYVKQTSAASPVIGRYNASSDPTATLLFRTARGTEAVPVTPSNGDEIASFACEAFYGSGAYDHRDFIRLIKRQSNGPSHVPYDVELLASQGNSTDPQLTIRLASTGLGGVGPISTLTPLSGWEINTTFGMTPTSVVATTFTCNDNTPPVILMDCTGGLATVILPFASGRLGRVVYVVKVDQTAQSGVIQTQGGATINGLANWVLFQRGDYVALVSDGANWWSLASSNSPDKTTVAGDASYNNSALDTQLGFIDSNNIQNLLGKGGIHRVRAAGKYSTTGTPTLRFRLKDQSGNALADSGAVTLPAGVTDACWQLDWEGVTRTPNAGPSVVRTARAVLQIGQTAGIGAAMNTYNMMDVAFLTNANNNVANGLWTQFSAASGSNAITLYALDTQFTPQTEPF